MAQTKNTVPDFHDIWQMMLRHWHLFLGIIVVSIFLGILLLRFLPQQYTASMIIGPTTTDGVAGRGARLTMQTPQTEFFRPSIAETDRNESLSDFSRFLELLTSVEVLRQHDKRQNGKMLKVVYEEQWNSETESWQPPASVGYFIKSLIKSIAGQKTWSAPTYSDLSKRLKSQIKIEPIGASAMRKVTYRHEDFDFGVKLLNSLYQEADEYLRTQARKRTKAEIDYLKKALNSVSILEHRKALMSLLAAQEQTQMMINVELPFAADKIESANAPAIPDWPNPFAVLIVFLMSGILLGIFIIYITETRHAE